MKIAIFSLRSLLSISCACITRPYIYTVLSFFVSVGDVLKNPKARHLLLLPYPLVLLALYYYYALHFLRIYSYPPLLSLCLDFPRYGTCPFVCGIMIRSRSSTIKLSYRRFYAYGSLKVFDLHRGMQTVKEGNEFRSRCYA